MKCPRCSLVFPFDKRLFRGNFACQQCGAQLFVSLTYSRALVTISAIFGFGLPWALGLSMALIRTLGPLAGYLVALALGFPIAIAILFVMVRALSHLIPPSLVLYHNDPITRLNLTSERGDDTGGHPSR